ncbi:MAG TPA: GNAT family N-acetyltransferase [Roseiflexaceae bacterium]|nr:GNAT family N-acetyltransferase [Roseiflexaceae bacterium]
MTGTTLRLDFAAFPLTLERWNDLEVLFGSRGACGGCWCMVWRLARSEFDRRKGQGNRHAFKAIVASGVMPGLLGYIGDLPVAWCAVAPREHYLALERSRVLKPVDEQPVWSVSCLFVAPGFRRQGLSVRLLGDVVAHANQCGARIVEGYPVEPRTPEMPAAFAWTGTASAFRQAGFIEVLRRSPTRTIMRYSYD